MIRCTIPNSLSFCEIFARKESKFIIFYVIFAILDTLIEEYCVFLHRVLKGHRHYGKKVAFAIYSTFKNVGV